MLTDSNAREHHSLGGCAWYRVVVFARDCRASCSRGTGRTAHVESVGVIAKIRCQQTGQQMSHCIVEGGPFDIACRELLATGDFVSWFDTYTQTESTGGHVFVAPAEPDKTSGEGNEEEGKTPPVTKGTPKPVQAVAPKAVAPAPAALGGNIIDKLMKPSQRKDKNSDGSNRLKFSCPSCKDNAWGKPTLMLICGRCQKPMAPTSQIPQTDSSENQESHAGA